MEYRMKILNLTQHAATPDQVAAGVVDLPPDQRELLGIALTMEEVPEYDAPGVSRGLVQRAALIRGLLQTEITRRIVADEPPITGVMIGGAAYLMAVLERSLHARSAASAADPRRTWPADLRVIHAFTRRDVREVPQPDGTVKKESRFVHAGSVELPRSVFGL